MNRLTKGALNVIQDKSERERLISNELFKLSSDRRALALRLARYLTETMHRPLIVAFDNVDRRESDQQLKIFQAAQWFRKETRAFSLLTLRDVTFERYKNEPPLDAFAQINNFYIRPPRFSLVLQKRLALAIEHGLKDLEEIEQSTSSGLRVRYSKEQLGLFLQNVYDALFIGENQVGRIVDALAERNVRDALGMFARILASGHFNADQVIGIGLGTGTKIENEVLIKILMRADYRLYSDDVGFIHNIFWSSSDHFSGNLFLTPEILGFFAQESASGSDKIAGYWRAEELLADLMGMGFEELEIRDSVSALLKWKMLAFDGEETDSLQDSDRIKITPSGFTASVNGRAIPSTTSEGNCSKSNVGSGSCLRARIRASSASSGNKAGSLSVSKSRLASGLRYVRDADPLPTIAAPIVRAISLNAVSFPFSLRSVFCVKPSNSRIFPMLAGSD